MGLGGIVPVFSSLGNQAQPRLCADTLSLWGASPGTREGAPTASLGVSFSGPTEGELGSEIKFCCAHQVLFYQVTASGVKSHRPGPVAHSWTKAIFVAGLWAKVMIIFLKN